MTTMARLRKLENGTNPPLKDGVVMNSIKFVRVVVSAALLDGAGFAAALVPANTTDSYKIKDIYLIGGGTNFGAPGDRLISLTDGTTVWTTIANADIEAAPAATLRYGNAKVPFLTGVFDTASVPGATLKFQYSGGTTDHGGVGSIVFDLMLVKVA